MNRNPRGCSNIGGSSAVRLEYCRNKVLKLFASYGYKPFSPAELQLVEDVWGKLSLSRARRLIAVTSPFGEPCVMRGDLTLSALAYLSSHFKDEERPLRLSYADRVFSVPQPPRNNLEENQAGVELIGWEGSGADAEIVSLLFRTLDALSIERSIVMLGDMSVVSSLFKDLPDGARELLVDALQEGVYTSYMRVLDGLEIRDDRQRFLKALPLLKGDCSVIAEAMAMADDPSILMPLKRLCDSLSKLGFADRLRVDLGFIRDLGYYSGPVFNAYSSTSGALLGGGGRYDGLLAKVGMDGEASGFALNLKELADHCIDASESSRFMLWYGGRDPADVLRYADGLCKKGISFELSWNADVSESRRIAVLRKYKYWVDYAAKKAVNLSSGEEISLEKFNPEAPSC